MSKSLRLSEQWFRRGLWLVAVIFAGFLIGLGSTVVGDLPRVEKQLSLDHFIDATALTNAQAAIKAANQTHAEANDALEKVQSKLESATADNRAAREQLENWLAARGVTQQASQDPEVLRRTKALDAIKTAERAAQAAVQEQEQRVLNTSREAGKAQQTLEKLRNAAQSAFDKELRAQELRVFLYRLALTLPLLVAAVWLFAKKRQSTYWPFVWGFIIFAVFAFFVELVPYLPSYGGYVRYIVGIIITVLAGRQAIIALNRYLEKQKLAEQLPDVVRREELSYDTALARLAKKVCPGCERAVDLNNANIDFCPHCGIGLFDHCTSCNTRKSTFSKFCHSCGCAAKAKD